MSFSEYCGENFAAAQLSKSFERFLLDLRSARPLAKIPDADVRGHSIAQAWNALVDGQAAPHQLNWLGDFFAHSFLRSSPPKQFAADHLPQAVDAGNLSWLDNMDFYNCKVTGERLYLEFEGWQPTMGRVDQGRLVPLDPVPGPQVDEGVLPAPSGHLLLADWFRIEEFNSLVKGDAGSSLSSEAGSRQLIQHYAKHGLMWIPALDSAPQVIPSPTGLSIVDVADDALGDDLRARSLGGICTDVWGVGAIDRQVLVNALSQVMPPDQAESKVCTLVASGSVTEAQVPPGTYHFYFCLRANSLEQFEAAGVAREGVSALRAVISRTPLTWTRRDGLRAPAEGPEAVEPDAPTDVPRA